MNVKIWPEYDDRGILVIYDGRFKDTVSFPFEATFLIPRGSIVSDACSVSPRGEHFCQLYKTKAGNEFDQITITLPYPNFYLSFHTPPLSQKGHKSFRYTVKILYPVDTMEVDIQQPLRSKDFSLNPPAQPTTIRGFVHYIYEVTDLKAGDTKSFEVSYYKADQKPSVDIKYSPPSMNTLQGDKASPYSAQRMVRLVLYGGSFLGLILLGILIVWFIRSKKVS